MQLIAADRRWAGATVLVAGTGPGLTAEVAAACKGRLPAIAVNDAHRLMPWADVLYACDAAWWQEYDGMLGFKGERWSSHSAGKDDKQKCGERWGLKLIAGAHTNGFSKHPHRIHYGMNSGFQAINLAILFGASVILLAGFDMQGQGAHFFGRHPKELRNSDPKVFLPAFNMAARVDLMPPGVKIFNTTPNTALKCWPCMPLDEALTMFAPLYDDNYPS